MTDAEQPAPHRTVPTRTSRSAGVALLRLVRYTILKGLALFLTVAAGLYLTILIANLGGYVDEIFRGLINESIGARIQGGWLKDLPQDERLRIIDETRWAMEEAQGLHQPFLVRSVRWMWSALTLELGEGRAAGARWYQEGQVQAMVFQRLPYTLALVGTSNLLLFLASVAAALVLSRKHAGLLDRLNVVVLSFTSAPSWILGYVLLLLLAGELSILPFPRPFEAEPIERSWAYARLLLQHMIAPALAVFLSGFFQGVYAWRTFFLLYRSEDYVEIAIAKGLSPRSIEQRYVLRPTLPYVITSFAMVMIGSWQGAIALEKLFMWPGVGSLFLGALSSFSTPMILGVVVTFAYLLALTVFVLDIVYAFVDPRVRVGGGGPTLRAAPPRRGARLRALLSGRAHRAQGPPRPRPTGRAQAESKPAPSEGEPCAAEAVPVRRPAPARRLLPLLGQAARRPSAAVGVAIILVMVGVSIYTVVTIPYQQAIEDWRAQGEDWYRSTWYRLPKNARPEWVNLFRKDKLPSTILLSTAEGTRLTGAGGRRTGAATKTVRPVSEGSWEVLLSFTFEYPYGGYPQEVVLYLDTVYAEKKPFAPLTWTAPGGRELDLGNAAISTAHNVYYLAQDKRLQRRYGEQGVIQAFFSDPAGGQARPEPGTYRMEVRGLVFEEGADLDGELIVYGRVSGLAGTDMKRRDLMLALLWGTPVALAFGLLGALGTSLLSMAIAALGVWYSGWVDGLVQRLTELDMILPTLPIAILVFILYSKTIWAILGVVVLLNIFGSAIKNYRAAFLQMRDAPYVEAARTYGASNARIIWRYLVPRVLPVMIPQMVIMVPAYVYYEATLAYLGVSDPNLPTWGKVIYDALTSTVLSHNAYWALEPIALLVLTGLAFAAVGFALDRVLNPRLRER